MSPDAAGPAGGDGEATLYAQAVDELVLANRILAHEGVLDAFGHASVRAADPQGGFLLARSMAPALAEPSDIAAYDLDGVRTAGSTGRPYLERWIHAAIYKRRPDVRAIVHSHSASVVPFSVSPTPLRPVFHMAGFLGEGAPVFDTRPVCGDCDLLIRTPELGEAMAQAMGASDVLLLRGHGSVVSAGSLRLAVYMAVFLEINARLQAQAIGLGPVTYLTAGEAASAAAACATQIDRPWELWARAVDGSTASPGRPLDDQRSRP